MILSGILATHADDLNYMVITMNGSGNIQIPLPLTEKPTLLVHGEQLEVQTDALNMGNINKSAVKHITYRAGGEWQGIADADASALKVSPRATSAAVTITGLKDDAIIALYNAAGAVCNTAVMRQADMATINMATLPKGIYILTINKESFKIVKK